MLRMLGKPYVLVLRGGNLPSYMQRQPERVARLLQSARAVAAPSGYLIEKLADCRGDIRLIPNAVETGDYLFRHRTRPAPRLVWLRSFHKLYNPAMAVEVLSRVAGEFPETTLLMVGPDKGDGTFEETVAAARRLGVEDRVEFQGTVAKKDVARWISRGDIFLNTTNVDNTPVSVVEAMACGMCIVSTDVGGVPYLLEHERDALLVPPRDPDAMAGAVRRVLTEPDLAGRLSANARLKAATFDWSAVLGEWERLLRSLGAGRDPACRAAERSFQS
jgi:glycosyltransferase involved in cell wall biosynthesis